MRFLIAKPDVGFEMDLVKNKDQEYFCRCRTRFSGKRRLCNPSLLFVLLCLFILEVS